jgi:ribonucleoside-diphosphate reductase alpha chain
MSANLMPIPPITAALTDNARTVLAKRYLIKDASGAPIEAPEDMFWRVATTIADVDRRYGADDAAVADRAREFYAMMVQRRFEPNSPTFTGAGRPLGQLSACFVLPVADALANNQDGIYDTLKNMALIHRSGGGTGFSFSRLRSDGAMVRSTTGVDSGPISFMKLYDKSTDVVKQGGMRRGANMGILRVDHPDVLAFIACKEDLTQVTNFNISVAVTDVFMRAVEQDGEYNLIDPNTKAIVGQLRARDVWERMIQGAWKTGEPGLFFIDEANRYNPVPHLGAYEATNPCGEQPLLPYDVCNLGSINIGYYVRVGGMDWTSFARDIHTATRFLDNVIDANAYPLPEVHQLAQRIRRIGLGVMGFADALIRQGIAYDSPAGIEFGRNVMEFLDSEAKEESMRIAAERGTFPEWAQSIWGPDATCARDADGQRIRPMMKLRNCNVSTVAPTGTISIIAGCSSGLEPLFAVAFMRNQAGVQMPDVNEDFVAIAKQEGWHSDDLMARIAKSGSVAQPEVPAKWQKVFVTANVIAPEMHIQMQAAFQQHCDSAISKTTNFAHSATIDDVRAIYEQAWRLKCKGVTVYRDGSRDGQVLSTGATATAAKERQSPADAATTAAQVQVIADLREALADSEAEARKYSKRVHDLESGTLVPRAKRERPSMLQGTTFRHDTPLGQMFTNITVDSQGQPFEVFISLGKAGGSAMADAEALGRMISLALRSGIPLKAVHKQLRGISSDRAVGMGPNKVLSMPDAVGIALEEWMRQQQGVQGELLAARNSGPVSVVHDVVTDTMPHAGRDAMTWSLTEDATTASAEVALFAVLTQTSHGTCPDCGSAIKFVENCESCGTNCGWSRCS